MTNISIESFEKLLQTFITPMQIKIATLAEVIIRLEQKIDSANGRSHGSYEEKKSSTGQLQQSIVQQNGSKKVSSSQVATLKGTAELTTTSTTQTTTSTRTQRAHARQQMVAAKHRSNDSSSAPLTKSLTPAPCTSLQIRKTALAPETSEMTQIAASSVIQNNVTELAPNQTQSNEGPWKTVSKRHRVKDRQVVCGNATSDSELEAVERTKRLHVCFLKPDTTVEALKTYMTKKNPSTEYHVEKLALRHQYYASFALTVPNSKYDFFMSADNWPERVEVSPWFRRGDGRATRPSSQPTPEANTGGLQNQGRGRRHWPKPRAAALHPDNSTAARDGDNNQLGPVTY